MQPLERPRKSTVLLDCQNPKGQQFTWSQYPKQPIALVMVSVQFHAFPVNEGHSETANEANKRRRAQFSISSLRSCVRPAPNRSKLAQVAFKSERQGFDQVDEQN